MLRTIDIRPSFNIIKIRTNNGLFKNLIDKDLRLEIHSLVELELILDRNSFNFYENLRLLKINSIELHDVYSNLK